MGHGQRSFLYYPEQADNDAVIMVKLKDYQLVYKTSTGTFFPACLMARNYQGRNFRKYFQIPLFLPDPVVGIITDGNLNWFLNSSCVAGATRFFNAFFRSSAEIKRLWRQEKVVSRQLLHLIKKPPAELFASGRLTSDGESHIRKIYSGYQEYGYYTDLLGALFQFFYEPKFQEDFMTAWAEPAAEKKETAFNFLLSSPKLTHYEQLLFALYRLYLDGQELTKEYMAELTRKFYWVTYDYFGEIVDQRYLEREWQNIKSHNKKAVQIEMSEAGARVKKIKQIKLELPAKLRRKIDILQDLLEISNERKKQVLNQVNIYLRQIVEHKLGVRQNNKLKPYFQLTHDEIIRLLQGEKITSITQRSRDQVYLLWHNKIERGDKKFLKLVDQQDKNILLKGLPAANGQVSGRVRIVLHISQINNFKKNEILVAPFTNVNYLPIMRRAKAILTETGGLTSHAAIVARELRIPCIVGIKNLIGCLQDGDQVEVDAEEGVVKINK